MPKILKICELCKKEIMPKDNYCRLTDYHLGKLFMEKFYHTLCFNNQRTIQMKTKAMILQTLAQSRKVLAKVGGGEPEQVFRVE